MFCRMTALLINFVFKKIVLLFFADGDGMRDNLSFGSGLETSNDDDDREAPSVVVYLVEPFSLGSDQPDMQRLAVLALLRCFQGVLTAVPENIRNNITVQVRVFLILNYLFLL